jgi:UPF0755 protein
MSGPPPVPGSRDRGPRTADRRPRARPPRAAGRGPRTRLTRRGRVVLTLLAVVIVAALWFANALFQPFHGDGSGNVSITIPRASTVGTIGDLLAHKGVISSSFFFQARATIGGHRDDLKAGTYALRRDMPYGDVLDRLSSGPPPPKVTRIVIPEGKSRREIARSISGLSGDYLAATKSSRLLNPADYGAENATDLEGFLFPATYELKPGSDVKDLVAKQLAAFKQNFAKIDMGYARRKHLTRYDVLIIASLVEREAQLDKERPLIAGVIYNRLKAGTPLGIDATLRYELNMWSRPLRVSELENDTPYNTRTRRGLPPTPIGNPGLKSLKAAAHPANTDFFFFVRKPGDSGEHAFSVTQAEFDRDVARYQASREP